MDAIFPITSLQKDTKAVRAAAEQDVVRITVDGHGKYIFCTEEVFERELAHEREQAALDSRIDKAIARGMADVEAGRVYSHDEAMRMVDEARARKVSKHVSDAGKQSA